jgi:acyl-[acyl-carrier-protein]-phospholipid O-acyltransferase/long-chain-fatty-acid--[acyl-carrier-protein] ligase
MVSLSTSTSSESARASDRRGFLGLVLAQFLGAFNDNAWKMLVVFLGMRAVTVGLDTTDPGFRSAREAADQNETFLAFLWFTIPLLVFSFPAAWIADRVSKRGIIVAMKALEVVLMLGAVALLALSPTGGIASLVLLALMGAQSAIFSPAKYSILPEIVPHAGLSRANGIIELWTFLAIIVGTGAAGTIWALGEFHPWACALPLALFAVLGFLASLRIPRVPAAAQGGAATGGLVTTMKEAWIAVRADRILWLAILGSAYYWCLATLLGQDLFVYTKGLLASSPNSKDWAENGSSWVLASIGIGVGIGAYLAGRLSKGKVEYGWIPIGAVGLAFFSFLLAIFAPASVEEGSEVSSYVFVLLLAFPLGVASGFIVVPLNAVLQWRSPETRRGAIIALSNVLVYGGIVLGAVFVRAFSALDWSAREILLGAAIVTLGGTIWALWLLPDAFVRLALTLLTHTIYRLRIAGAENLPRTGGVLLVPNHVSLIDGLLLLASTDRPVRFLVESSYYQRPLLAPFLRAIGAIPIASSGGPRVILRALRAAGEALESGEVVCIFAEGQITRTGMLLPFRRGFERIVKGRNVLIVPVWLDRVWGSIFSWSQGRFFWKLPSRIPYRVGVSFGAPLPSGTSVSDARRAVQDLSAAAWESRKPERRPLHHELIRNARRSPFRFAIADLTRPSVSRIRAVAGAIALARALRERWGADERVGVLLPPSVAGALVNIAASISGRASVNLNYTSGPAGMSSAARQAGLRTVVTSRLFLEKARVELPDGVEPIWIDEIAARVKAVDRYAALILALIFPVRLIESICGARRRIEVDDIVTVIFSSGSSGDPKGILLSHFNIDSNIEALAQVLRVEPSDRLLGILPLFHSFGYSALWFSLNERVASIFHPTPLDAAGIGELIERYRITFLIATPTFLQLYMRRCTPAQFGSLRVVISGAERLPERVATAFEDHFGVRPLSGYGATECAPAISTNVPDYRAPGFYQAGSRRGSVGLPLPGVRVRVVDPEREFDPATSEPLPAGKPGLLVVRGPNVMRGYLGREDLTSKALIDGWYVTGDIVSIDEDGFITITDRLSRFSKIGGEMVPHGRIEDALHQAIDSDALVFAVTAVPDDSKGERIAVLHTLGAGLDTAALVAKLQSSGLPNLFLPRPDAFIAVDSLPLLGTGKIDLQKVRNLARERLGAGQAAANAATIA